MFANLVCEPIYSWCGAFANQGSTVPISLKYLEQTPGKMNGEREWRALLVDTEDGQNVNVIYTVKPEICKVTDLAFAKL